MVCLRTPNLRGEANKTAGVMLHALVVMRVAVKPAASLIPLAYLLALASRQQTGATGRC